MLISDGKHGTTNPKEVAYVHKRFILGSGDEVGKICSGISMMARKSITSLKWQSTKVSCLARDITA